MLIPFPVAFLVGALLTDLAFIATGDGFWARASIWLIGAGIVMALLAAVAGFTDFFGEPRIRALNDAISHVRQSYRSRNCGHQFHPAVRSGC
jgi:uncharacterized membrane protein